MCWVKHAVCFRPFSCLTTLWLPLSSSPPCPPPPQTPQVFYRSNPAREAFVEMCEDSYVQKMTFDSYLYKTVVPGNPIDDVKLLVRTVASIVRANALRGAGKGPEVNFGSKATEQYLASAK